MSGKHKYLFKANDDVLSHCTCVGAPAMSSGQLDCPWCGCGWMTPCSRCSKSFVFGEVRETDTPLLELGRREAATRGLRNVTDEELLRWTQDFVDQLSGAFEVGDVVVYRDGGYFRIDQTDIAFDGFFASHDLKRLPHVEALDDPDHLRRVLGDPKYWFDSELPDRHLGDS